MTSTISLAIKADLRRDLMKELDEIAKGHTLTHFAISEIPLAQIWDARFEVDGEKYALRIIHNPTMTPVEQLLFKFGQFIKDLEASNGHS
jgi:hypothetical protein